MSICRFVRWSFIFLTCQVLWTSGVSAAADNEGGAIRDARAFARALPASEPSGYDFHLLYSFPAGASPTAGLNSVNGMLYGTDTDSNNAGDVFAATTSGTVTVLHHFAGVPDGAVPDALTVADGQLYGVTERGGNAGPHDPTGCGTVFAVAFSGSETMRSPFSCAQSSFPNGKLVRYNGALFGETFNGGAHDSGTFFVAHDDGTKNIIYSFPGYPNDEPPEYGLTALGGTFYGISDGSREEIFAILPTGAEKVIYTFSNPCCGRVFPTNRLTAVNGVLYGTTGAGGANGGPTVYSLTPSGSLTVLAELSTIGGLDPSSPLIAMGGALYGTTQSGGKYYHGMIYKLTDAGVLTVLYSFRGSDGSGPAGDLVEIGRSLYGTTKSGGANNGGTLYRITP